MGWVRQGGVGGRVEAVGVTGGWREGWRCRKGQDQDTDDWRNTTLIDKEKKKVSSAEMCVCVAVGVCLYFTHTHTHTHTHT